MYQKRRRPLKYALIAERLGFNRNCGGAFLNRESEVRILPGALPRSAPTPSVYASPGAYLEGFALWSLQRGRPKRSASPAWSRAVPMRDEMRSLSVANSG